MEGTGRGEPATTSRFINEIKQKRDNLYLNKLSLLSVGVAGLEPATTCTPCKHASQLHHTPICCDIIKSILKNFGLILRPSRL